MGSSIGQPKSLVVGFDCVPSFSGGEVASKRASVQSRSSGCELEGNLDVHEKAEEVNFIFLRFAK